MFCVFPVMIRPCVCHGQIQREVRAADCRSFPPHAEHAQQRPIRPERRAVRPTQTGVGYLRGHSTRPSHPTECVHSTPGTQ